MKIFSAKQVRDIDEYTIKNKPIESIQLMENASKVFFNWFVDKINYNRNKTIAVICGKGNNGGDGLAVARMLHLAGYKVTAFVLEGSGASSLDYRSNLYNFQQLDQARLNMISEDQALALDLGDFVIDAILGSGLDREVTGFYKKVITQINYSNAEVFSIDIPSGLFADGSSKGGTKVYSHEILSFQFPKLAFLFPENYESVKNWETLPIGLHENKIENSTTRNFYADKNFIKGLIIPRNKFDHKGTYGHAELIVGSKGMMGAAILSSLACLRSGVGLLSLQIPNAGYNIMQTAVPEAMISHLDELNILSEMHINERANALGIGPGLGQDEKTLDALEKFLTECRMPIVIDADALNLIASRKTLLQKIPQGAIITPHVKEFERLFGSTGNDFDRHRLQKVISDKYKIFIVLKGAHSCITTPESESYFNSSGNHGMATAGSGDVLTGIITSLLAQGYDSKAASILGVYIHGLAGDLAAEQLGPNGMIASDIINKLPLALKKINNA